MTNTTLFLVIIGAATVTSWLFRIVDAIAIRGMPVPIFQRETTTASMSSSSRGEARDGCYRNQNPGTSSTISHLPTPEAILLLL